MRGIFATDDEGVSDLLSGELPARAEIGAMIRSGQLPLWSNQSCGGYPMHAGGAGVSDPMTLAWFVPFAPAIALNLFLLTCLTIASQGAYTLCRRFQASRTGAVLAGIVWAQSGFVVCNLRHPGMLATICWTPFALTLLEDAVGPAPTGESAHATPPTTLDRLRAFTLFALTFGLQNLAGFPQLDLYCGLIYGAFAIARIVTRVRAKDATSGVGLRLVGATALAGIVGAAIGAVALLPMAELARVSDRSEGITFDFAAVFPMDWRDLWTFVRPYALGDPSKNTYTGRGNFLDNYGYVGLLPLALAVAALIASIRIRERRWAVWFFGGLSIFTTLFALGPNTPVFKLLFFTVPEMSNFRLPSRVLGCTDLALAVLAGLGATALQAWFARARGGDARPRLHAALACALVAAAGLDLYFVQARINPIVNAAEWLRPPQNATTLATTDAARGETRIFTPEHISQHAAAHFYAHGWSDLRPYLDLRENLEPNINLLYGLATADCHAGLSPLRIVDFWGDRYNYQSVISPTFTASKHYFFASRAFYKLLAMDSVGYIMSRWPMKLNHLEDVSDASKASADRFDDRLGVPAIRVYRVRDVLPRVRFEPTVYVAKSEADASAHVLTPAFDPGREVVLHDAPAGVVTNVASVASAQEISSDTKLTPVASRPLGSVAMVKDRPGAIEATVSAPQDGWIVVADTHYPGWRAWIDDVEVPILRANFIQRAVAVRAGEHRLRMTYRPVPVRVGAALTATALFACAVTWGVARRRDKPARAA